MDTDEFRGLQVKANYQRIFGRAPDPTEVSFWVGQMRTAKLSSTDVAIQFLTSQEFNNANPTSQNFVDAIYRVLLNRLVDAASLTYWTGQLNSGATTRTGMILAIFDSTESRMLALDAIYAQILQRPIDAGSIPPLLPTAANGTTLNPVIVSLLASNEFALRTSSLA
jgi:hypothetical protein